MVSIVNVNRQSLVGDCICSLIFSTYLEKLYPNSTKIALLDHKCQSLAPLLIGAPGIDGIYITEKPDIITENDRKYFNRFDLVFNPFPQPTEELWFNKMDVREQIFKMSTLLSGERINPEEWKHLTKEERRPRLNVWFQVDDHSDYIAIWSSSGYSKDLVNQKRNPSKEYWNKLVTRLLKEGYKVAQLGLMDHEKIHQDVLDLRYLSLFDAVKFSLGSKTVVGNDSGSQHVLSAYGINQLILSTYWRSGHVTNKKALLPINYKNRAIYLWDDQNINMIDQEKVIEGIKILNE